MRYLTNSGCKFYVDSKATFCYYDNMNDALAKSLVSFFSKFKIVNYKKGELIYQQGETINEVAFAHTGYIRLFSINKEGKEATINLFKPVFPITLIYSRKNKILEYSLEAADNVEIFKCYRHEFDKYLNSSSELSNLLMIYLENICIDLLNNVSDSLSGNSLVKISRIMLSLCKNHGVKKENYVVIDVSLTHSTIASLTGLARETVSLQLKKLENLSLIKQENNLLIISDIGKLSDHAQI